MTPRVLTIRPGRRLVAAPFVRRYNSSMYITMVKKRLADGVPFVVVDSPGRVRQGVEVSGTELDAALAGIGV